MAKVKLTGRCGCGAVRYELSNLPLITHCCHCTDCQRQSGSAFAVNALIEAGEVHVNSGALDTIELPTDSGHPHDVYNCTECGGTLWSDYGRRGYLIYVRAGTLDAPHPVNPDVHIHTRSKRDWVQLPQGVPAFEKFYSMGDVWSKQAQARRQAASDKSKAQQ